MKYAMMWILIVALSGITSCSKDEGNNTTSADSVAPDSDGAPSDAPDQGPLTMMDMMNSPSLSITPDEFIIPMLGEGERVIRSVTLRNDGESSVEINRVAMEINSGSAALSYGPRQLVGITPSGVDTFNYPIVIESGDTLDIAVEYTLGDDEPGGQVTLEGNFSDAPVTLPIRALESVGQVSLNTEEIDFGRVRENTIATQDIVMTNVGQSALNIIEITKERGVYYSLGIGDVDPLEEPDSYADPDGDGVPGLAPGASLTITVTFAPTRENAQQSQVIIRTDDPTQPEVRVSLAGNMNPGCIEVSPAEVDWMGPSQVWTASPTITVGNCGDGPLVIDRIALLPGSDAFELVDENLPMFPTTLEAGADPLSLTVNYGPPYPRVYRGQLEVLSNDPAQSTLYVSLIGRTPCADEGDCPEGFMCVEQSCLVPDGE